MVGMNSSKRKAMKSVMMNLFRGNINI
ncbi:uncharacterized protein METZ01_LOCUS116948 [marine metagenome]|uniref:Uncharacterized protein n=1 Tax=marine metagenome TaxID=408172 RepID=A0A381XH41_9ZZZZ